MVEWFKLTTGLFDLGGPPFVIVMLGLTYLLWAKFFNRGVLKIDFASRNAVDKVSEVLLLFLALLLTLIELPLFIPVLAAVRDMDIFSSRMDAIWSSATAQVILLGLTGILLLASVYRYKQPEDSELPGFFTGMLLLHVVMTGALAGLVLWAMIWPITPTLTGFLALMFITLMIGSCFSCYATIFLWRGTIRTSQREWRVIGWCMVLAFIVMMVLGGGWAFASSSAFVQEQTVTRAYYLSPVDYGALGRIDADAMQRMPVRVNSLGHAGPFFNMIAIRYRDSGIEHRDGQRFSMGLTLINASGNETLLASGVSTLENYGDKVQKKHGIVRIRDLNNESFVLWYDANILRAEDVARVALDAIKPVILNSSQYRRVKFVECTGPRCIVHLNLTNNLPVQVEEQDYTIALLDQYGQNASACRLGNITYRLAENGGGYRTRQEVCSGRSCNIGVNQDTQTFRASVHVESGAVQVSHATFRAPAEALLSIEVLC